MSISSSIYVGSNGVIAQQKQMSVISDNISNVSTTGFKSSRLSFQTLMSEQLAGADVGNQIGQGVGIGSILRDMRTGTLETTNTATDLAIGGKNGFFLVSPEGSEEVYYTRAGSFRFDQSGYLRDPQNNIVQGYRLPAQSLLGEEQTLAPATTVPMEDIHLNMDENGIVSNPEASTEIRMMINLDSAAEDKTINADSPFTSLFDAWDATQEQPLATGTYAYESSLKIYDADGQTHELTAFFDPVSTSSTDTKGYTTWEYLITLPGAEDASALEAKKGILMAGTMTFTPSGDLANMSAFSGTGDDKSTWTPVPLSEDGFPVLNATINGAAPIAAALDLGLRSTSTSWTLPEGTADLADLGTDFTALPQLAAAQRDVLSTTSYNSGSGTIYQSQNGYARGYLQSVSVDTSGTLVGNFSNGQDQALYKIPLADFINPQGLFRKGDNLLAATKDSGAATMGWAGEGRLGLLAPKSLETSNVDLATEFVNMITTQKAFDANSKVISTSDQVVQTAIQMKK